MSIVSLTTIIAALESSQTAREARAGQFWAMPLKERRGVIRYLRDKGYHVESVKVGGYWYAKISNPNYSLLGEARSRYKGDAQWEAFIAWQVGRMS